VEVVGFEYWNKFSTGSTSSEETRFTV